MNQHLFNTVSKIVKRHSGSSIRHTAFSGIRNQETVRAALEKLNHIPNCPTSPTVWRLNDGTAKRDSDAPRFDRQYKSQDSKIRDALISGELLVIKEQSVSKRYVVQIAGDLRKQGYKVKSNFNKKREVVSYEIINPEANPLPIPMDKNSQSKRLVDSIIKNGFVNVSDFEGDKQYLIKLIYQMRRSGIEIKTVRKGMKLVRYELVK